MSQVIPIEHERELAARFWGIARGMESSGQAPDSRDPVAVVRHVLAVLDALDRGERGTDLSVRTMSFLKLLRECELRGDLTYASPEQIRGEQLDERSLVFSVGVLLFERLTGRHPFGAEGNTVRRVARIRKGELGSGVNYFPHVPAGLRSVLMRAMGPFREERFTSLAELRARLEQFINDQSPAPRLPGTSEGWSPPAKESTLVVKAPVTFARDLMAAAEAHNANVKARRRRMSHTSAPPARGTAAEPSREVSQIIELSQSMIKRPAPREPEPVDAPLEAQDARVWEPDLEQMPTSVRAPEPADSHDTHDDIDTDISRAVTAPLDRTRARRHPHAADTGSSNDAAEPAGLRHHPLFGRALWLGLGAVIAAAIMLFLWPETQASSAAAHVPPAPPAPAPAPVVEEPEPSVPQAEPLLVFDPELGGQKAAELALSCFAPARLESSVSFRVGLLYPARQGGVSRVYFAPTEEIPVDERVCVREKLLGMVAGAPPDKGLVVDYQLQLSTHASQATIK